MKTLNYPLYDIISMYQQIVTEGNEKKMVIDDSKLIDVLKRVRELENE